MAKVSSVFARFEHLTVSDMSIELAEKLKRELTDKWVVVAQGVPELRRFASLTGRIKTVNMNCRALVQFDGPEDISWYDIDPHFLTVVDGPRPKAKTEEKAHNKGAAADSKVAPAAKPASGGGGSPLDKIRGAAGGAKPAAAGGGSPLDKIRSQGGSAAPAAKPAGGSPLDKIRAAGAAKAEEQPAAETPAAEKAPAAKPVEKKPATGSPLDQIRSGGGFKG
jgi:hypothetical protein